VPEDTQKEELTFGQVAILQGYTTPERVRECLEIQEKIRSIGGKPRLLGDILYEKGYLTAEQINRIFQVQQAYQNQAKGILNIPGYEILSKIGQGGMGAVYRARQISMDRAVALKVLPPRLARDRQFVDRFLNEARAVARLRHENIILGIDAGEANGLYYFVMEFVEGETVQGILRRDGRLDEKRALKIAQQIAAALQHAFDNRMVHRDIKPSNILITREGTAKLCDLGLAKVQHRGDAGNTQTGMAVGTPHYISPEQARGESEVDIRSDIYSLGASIYHMVTGEVPFTGPNAAVVMSKHVTTPPTPPREKNGSLSSAVNDLILKCMSKHREHRFQTPADLIAEIRKVLDAATAAPPRRPEPARPAVAASLPPPPSLRRHTQKRSPVPGLIALGMAAVAGIIVLQLLPPSRTTVPVPPTRIPGGSSGNAPGGSGGVTPVPGRTEADTRLQQLQGEIQAVLADGARLRELPALHARLEAFAKSTAGTALADAAAALLDDYRGKVNAKSDEAWRAAREAADEPLRAGRLAAALDRYRAFPTELRAFNPGAEKPEPLMTTRGGREVDSAVRDLQFRIRSSYLTHVQEIEQSLGRNDLRRAWTAGLAMVPYTSEDLLKESDPELRALPEKRDERLLGILTHEIDALCKASKFAEARARCDELQKNEDLPASVRQKAAQTGLDLGRRETEWRQGLRQFLWTAYQAELGGPVRKALESRDIETGKQALTAFLFRRLEERKTFLWLPEIDYPKLVQPALAPAPLTADALALLVIAIGKALGTANPDVTQDAARAALLDLRAVLLFDDLLRQADAGARAFASTGEAVTLVSSQALDRSFFPGARCQIVLDKGTEFFFLPYGKAAPRIGFSLGKGTAQPLLEDDVIALASRTWDAVAKRWKPVPADPIQRFKYGLLLYHGGKKEKQKQSATELEAARAGGVPALDRYLGGGAGSAAPPPSAGTPPAAPAAGGSRAQDFQDQLDLVRDLVRKAADKKTTWAFARKELNDLTAEFGGDPTFADKKAEIEALRAQIEAGLKPK
jgi:serine/threonine-protein kinase